MISFIKSGYNILVKHTQLIFVAVLMVVFPLLFIFTLQQFIEVARANTSTVIYQKVDTIQDNLEFLVKNNLITENALESFSAKQEDLKKVRIIKEVDDKLIIINDLDTEKINKVEENVQPFKTSLINSGETVLFNPLINGAVLTQAFRSIKGLDGYTYYIFTEHDFSSLNSLLENRIEKSYLIFTFIFLFLIALAYWIARQINFEQKFIESVNELKERDLFINGLVHEFRTPLTAIKGYASLIEENTIGENKGFSTRIREASSRLVLLVNDFLEVSRIQSKKLNISNVEIDVKVVVEKVVSDMKSLANTKSLQLKTNLQDESVTLLSDEKRLIQILTNIISNAIKYTNKGEITVSLAGDRTQVKIVVADTGDGISAEDQKKLFSPFVRVGSAEQMTQVVGSGLGMWITRQLVTQLGGTISLESIKGVGTHVIIKLNRKLS